MASQLTLFRRPTNTAQRPPADKMDLIKQFHREIRKSGAIGEGDEQQSVGRFKLSQVANMDQTPLLFSFCEGPIYADTGEKTVWVRGGASGIMGKRQCTVQLTIFADGEGEASDHLQREGPQDSIEGEGEN